MMDLTGLAVAVSHGAGALPVTEFGVVVLLALFLGIIVSRFGISSSIGFILAGLILGNQGLRYISETGLSTSLGEIGLLMILFYLGLELNIKKFKETGPISLVMAAIEMAGAFSVGFVVAKLFGVGDLEAMIIGAMLMSASTVEAVKFMIEENILKTLEARIAISALIVQDLIAVLAIVLLSSIATKQSFGITALNALVFVVAMFFIIGKLSGPILAQLEKWGQQNKIVLFALGVGITVSYLGEFLGLSAIIGAYFAGFALSETPYHETIKRELGFFRELFILFFFVSFGSKVLLPTATLTIALIAAIIIIYTIVKLLDYGLFGTAIGLNAASAITIGTIMIPIGEFGIIMATIAEQMHLTECAAGTICAVTGAPDLLTIAFSLTIVTTLIGPLLFKYSQKITELFTRIYPTQVRQTVNVVGDDVRGIENMLVTKAFQNTTLISLKSIFINLAIAGSVAYISYALRREITFSFLHGVPTNVILAILLLPILIWPIYKAINELMTLTKIITTSITTATGLKTSGKKQTQVENNVAETITSFFLVAIGAIATTLSYTHFQLEPLALVVPALFTILALLQLTKTMHFIINHQTTTQATKRSNKNQ